MKKLLLAITVLALSACSTMPRYAVSVDNNQALKILSGINGEFV